MKDPYPVIHRIADDLRQFQRDFTEAPRLIGEYLDLVDLHHHPDAEEWKQEKSTLEEENGKNQTSIDEIASAFVGAVNQKFSPESLSSLLGTVLDETWESDAFTGDRNDFEKAISAIESHLYEKETADENANLVDSLGDQLHLAKAEIAKLQARIAELESAIPAERSATWVAASTKDWLDYFEVKSTIDCHTSPKFPRVLDSEIITRYTFTREGLTLITATGEHVIATPGGPVLISRMVHNVIPAAERSATPEPPAAPAKPKRKRAAAPPASGAPPVLTRTPKGKALELRFDGVPAEEIRNEMKDHGFRWSGKRQAWLAAYSEESLIYAAALAQCDPSPIRKDSPETPEPEGRPSHPPSSPTATAAPSAPDTPRKAAASDTKPRRSLPRGFTI